MATHTTALSLYKAQLARYQRVKVSIANVNKDMAEQGRHDLVELTKGGIKSKELRKRGHPYGRGSTRLRRGKVVDRGSAPRQPINIQSGKLHRSITVMFAGRNKFDLSISAPYAKYILHPSGTKKMVGRGVMGWRDVNKAFPMGEIEKRHRLRTRAYRDALKSAHRR